MSNVTFSAKQAYVATLAMRLGKPVPVATIVGWSPQQLQAAISSANKRLSVAQANAQAAGVSGVLRPVRSFQQAALSAWSAGLGLPVPQVNTAYQANTALIAAGKRSKGQHQLVLKVYQQWLSAMSVPAGQGTLFNVA